jgi:hypothetical protein
MPRITLKTLNMVMWWVASQSAWQPYVAPIQGGGSQPPFFSADAGLRYLSLARHLGTQLQRAHHFHTTCAARHLRRKGGILVASTNIASSVASIFAEMSLDIHRDIQQIQDVAPSWQHCTLWPEKISMVFGARLPQTFRFKRLWSWCK